MNTFINALDDATNYEYTENGGLAHGHLNSAVYQMFAVGGSYRNRSDEDCILLFKRAYEEDPTLALKCLFYIRDVQEGAGERRFFRVCYRWLATNYPEVARRNMAYISLYGRYDDVIYSLVDTCLEPDMLKLIKHRLEEDMRNEYPSLCGKWVPSCNASSPETKRVANIIRRYMNLTHKQYRKMLSLLRERIKVLERLMSANRWNEIDFSKIPSKAGLIYRETFENREETAQRYEEFINSKETKVNAGALYPYEIVAKALKRNYDYWNRFESLTDTERATLEKYWNNQKDYFHGKQSKMLCVIDTSGSMTGSKASAPINVAISLGMYCAERLGGPYKDCFVTFSEHPQFIKVEGVDFVDKVRRIYDRNECANTDLVKTFRLLKDAAKQARPQDRPDTIVVISDMEIDCGSYFDDEDEVLTEMEKMRKEWEAEGLEMPRLVYWCVDSRNRDLFLDASPNVSYVSGFSPNIFECVLSGKNGYTMMLEKLNSIRYNVINIDFAKVK